MALARITGGRARSRVGRAEGAVRNSRPPSFVVWSEGHERDGSDRHRGACPARGPRGPRRAVPGVRSPGPRSLPPPPGYPGGGRGREERCLRAPAPGDRPVRPGAAIRPVAPQRDEPSLPRSPEASTSRVAVVRGRARGSGRPSDRKRAGAVAPRRRAHRRGPRARPGRDPASSRAIPCRARAPLLRRVGLRRDRAPAWRHAQPRGDPDLPRQAGPSPAAGGSGREERVMTCLSELTCAVYVDGELSPEETRAAERHLAECARCRALVAALHGENRALSAALDAVATTVPASRAVTRPAPTPARAATANGRRSGVWRLVVAALVAASGLALVAVGMGWGDPAGRTAGDWIDLGVEAGLFVLLNAATLEWMLATVAVLTMTGLALIGGLYLARAPVRAILVLALAIGLASVVGAPRAE